MFLELDDITVDTNTVIVEISVIIVVDIRVLEDLKEEAVTEVNV